MIKKPLKELDNRLLKIKSLMDLSDLLPQMAYFGYSLAFNEARDTHENFVKSLKNKNTKKQLKVLIDEALYVIAHIAYELIENECFYSRYLGTSFDSKLDLYNDYSLCLQDFKSGELTKDEFLYKYDFKNGANGGVCIFDI